ncbi:RNA polymerase factor sigma-54 [Paenibacillus whitsoniae]|nr:RNA polymerase factor sigma-54 [Paenibacillus whitsoniae]
MDTHSPLTCLILSGGNVLCPRQLTSFSAFPVSRQLFLHLHLNIHSSIIEKGLMRMRSGYGMFQQPSAKLRLSPYMRQTITLLKLSTLELLEAIQQEVNKNPVLDYAGGGDFGGLPGGSRALRRAGRDSAAATAGANAADPLLHTAANDRSLERHLSEQLSLLPQAELPPPLPRILRFLIGSLDESGYLTLSVQEAASLLRTAQEAVEAALAVLHKLDPPGVGARSLQECLLLQLSEVQERSRPLAAELIRCHLADIGKRPLPMLAARLRTPPQELQTALNEIKRLHPRPGARFHHAGLTPYIVPEVILEPHDAGIAVYACPAAWPRLSLSRDYERLLHAPAHDEAGAFVQGKWNTARLFLRSLEQRRDTILRVARALAEEQADYLRQGPAGLKPLTLREIADRLGLHESTVSRAVSGKYAQTPWGVKELKSFFASGLQTDVGDTASSASVKAQIQTRILEENYAFPYSDQQLAELLRQEGIRISRRTVAKYREELGIPPSTLRRRL